MMCEDCYKYEECDLVFESASCLATRVDIVHKGFFKICNNCDGLWLGYCSHCPAR